MFGHRKRAYVAGKAEKERRKLAMRERRSNAQREEQLRREAAERDGPVPARRSQPVPTRDVRMVCDLPPAGTLAMRALRRIFDGTRRGYGHNDPDS